MLQRDCILAETSTEFACRLRARNCPVNFSRAADKQGGLCHIRSSADHVRRLFTPAAQWLPSPFSLLRYHTVHNRRRGANDLSRPRIRGLTHVFLPCTLPSVPVFPAAASRTLARLEQVRLALIQMTVPDSLDMPGSGTELVFARLCRLYVRPNTTDRSHHESGSRSVGPNQGRAVILLDPPLRSNVSGISEVFPLTAVRSAVFFQSKRRAMSSYI
jgi:hypothetical protein